jgi:hypothetical protein
VYHSGSAPGASGGMIKLEAPVLKRGRGHPGPGTRRNGVEGGVCACWRFRTRNRLGVQRCQPGVGHAVFPLIVTDYVGVARIETTDDPEARCGVHCKAHPLASLKLRTQRVCATLDVLPGGPHHTREQGVGRPQLPPVICDHGGVCPPFPGHMAHEGSLPVRHSDAVGNVDLLRSSDAHGIHASAPPPSGSVYVSRIAPSGL